MAVLFRGSGLAWIPSKHRSVRFVDGVYSTDDADEIAVLAQTYEHDIPNKVGSENIPDRVQNHWHGGPATDHFGNIIGDKFQDSHHHVYETSGDVGAKMTMADGELYADGEKVTAKRKRGRKP